MCPMFVKAEGGLLPETQQGSNICKSNIAFYICVWSPEIVIVFLNGFRNNYYFPNHFILAVNNLLRVDNKMFCIPVSHYLQKLDCK